MKKRRWSVVCADKIEYYTSMFPETAAELWGKDFLSVGSVASVSVCDSEQKTPGLNYCCSVNRDPDRVWVKRTAIK